MSQIICRKCNAANPEGSKFCSHCGSPLKPATHIACENCGHRNPIHLIYCDNCGHRLVKDSPLSAEEEKTDQPNIPQGFDLPSRLPGATGRLSEDDLPDWLRTGQEEIQSEPEPEDEERLADWLAQLKEEPPTPETQADKETFGFGDLDEVALPDWMQSDEVEPAAAESEEEDEAIDWLGDAGLSDSKPDSDVDAESLPAAEEHDQDLDWLSAMGTSEDEAETGGTLEEDVDWLSMVGSEDNAFRDEEDAGPISTGFTGFLDPETLDQLTDSPPTQEAEADAWLDAIPDEATDDEVDQIAAEEDAWLSDFDDSETDSEFDWLTGDAAEAQPTAVEEEADSGFTNWLENAGILDEESEAAAAQAEEIPDWLQPPVEEHEEPAEAEGTGFTDWLSESDLTDDSTAIMDTPPPGITLEGDEGDSREDTDSSSGRKRTGFTDWLTDSGVHPTPAAEEDDLESGQGFTDWLLDSYDDDTIADIMAEEEEEEEEPVSDAAIAEAVEADFPDWLTDVQPSEEVDIRDTLPGWLDVPTEDEIEAAAAELRADDQVSEEERAFSFEASDAGTEGIDLEEGEDWLSGLSAAEDAGDEEDWLFDEEDAEEYPAGAPAGEGWLVEEDTDGEEDDWLSDMPAFDEAGEDDWLTTLDSAYAAEGPPSQEAPEPAQSETAEPEPDWMADELAAVDEEGEDWLADMPPTAGESDAWMAEVDALGADAEASESDSWLDELESFETPAEETGDDWLSDFDAIGGSTLDWLEERPPTAPQEPEVEGEAVEGEADFDRQEAEEEPAEAAPSSAQDPVLDYDTSYRDEAPDEEEGELDWLSALEVTDLEAEPGVDEEAEFDREDWLQGADLAEEAEQPSESEIASADFFDSNLPDWAAELAEQETPAEAGTPETTEEDFFDFSQPFEEPPEAEEEDAEFLAELRAMADQKEDTPLPDTERVPFSNSFTIESDAVDLMPIISDEALADELGFSAEEVDGDEVPDLELADLSGQLAAAELPDWLERQKEAEDAAAGLEKADEIPEWIRDRRPGAEIPDEDEELEPQVGGPLDGLSGVLAVAPSIARPVEKVRPVQADFIFTEEHGQQAALLRQIIQPSVATNGAAVQPAVAAPERRRFDAITRLALGLLLIAAVLAGLWQPNLLPAASPPTSAALTNVNDIVGTLNNQTVLVAFEYTPAFSGELNPQARLLLQQLADGGNDIFVLSQYPAGMATAEPLLADLVPDANRLGYLPGDAISLRQLADCLEARATCRLPFGPDVDVTALQDVAAVVVLTGERDSLVGWVEQVGANSEVPLVLGVTEALTPVSEPYTASGQIDGLMHGLTDAAAYEQAFAGGAAAASQRFQAQALAQILVAGLMVIGGIVYLLSRQR